MYVCMYVCIRSSGDWFRCPHPSHTTSARWYRPNFAVLVREALEGLSYSDSARAFNYAHTKQNECKTTTSRSSCETNHTYVRMTRVPTPKVVAVSDDAFIALASGLCATQYERRVNCCDKHS